MRWVLHQGLQRRQRLPVIHVGDQPVARVLPRLFAQVAGQGAGCRGNGLVQAVKGLVKLARRKNEGGCVHACFMAGPEPQRLFCESLTN